MLISINPLTNVSDTDDKSNQQINELQEKYEAEKKAKETQWLKKNNEIQQLRLSRERITRYGLITGETRLTESGNFLGTLQYLAPEQVLDAYPVPANDIFSMGVIFYHMLCGKRPFTGETAIDVLRQIIIKEPLKVSGCSPDIPGELDILVMEMLDKDPGQRPSAESVRDTLQRINRNAG